MDEPSTLRSGWYC